MSKKYLTKSLFKIGLLCPRKLYYYNHPKLYQNQLLDDPFLEALAEGGFQVGELAKTYHPEGIDLSELTLDEAIKKTNTLLNENKVTIFEATFVFEDLLVKVDILKKDGNQVSLFEVKSKSYDSQVDSFFKKSQDSILSSWEKYLYDITYQTFVCRKSRPSLIFNPFLMLIDKNAVATVEGLNQKFFLMKCNQNKKVKVKAGTNVNTVGQKILIEVDATKAVEMISGNSFIKPNKTNFWDQTSFEGKILELTKSLKNDERSSPRLDSKCRKCEFRCIPDSPRISGFKECWKEKVDIDSLDKPFVFDVWRYASKSDDILNDNRILMEELTENDFETKSKAKTGLSQTERQWLQVKLSVNNQNKKYFDKENFHKEMKNWKYPLHFIDFETARVALPFNSERRPYEQIAFQLSHHVVYENGELEHVGQYLDDLQGDFPNFKFVRNLKDQLEKDDGTIFRYSHHENTVLNEIANQLQHSREPDKEALIKWIKTVTTKDKESGNRSMVDLCELVINYFYHPFMKGSNSLKIVLPTILRDSEYLKNKYKLPIYGTTNGVKSLNFNNWAWIQYDQNLDLIDPYELLPKLFDNIDSEKLEMLFEEDEITQGGAAMTAYAKMQFTEMSDMERLQLRKGLLKYCELDTFAMVLLYEYFLEESKLEIILD